LKDVKDKDDQVDQKGVFELPALKKRCKPEALTKQVKEFRAYHSLRLARINKRYAGIREKRAKEAEEKKK